MQDNKNTMKAIFIDRFGGPEQLKIGRLNIPKPGPGEVQIRIIYSAVNPVDWKIRTGLLEKRIPHYFPAILGWDASGIISELGSGVNKFKVGDEIFAYCRKPVVKEGTYAEYICYPAENVAFKPKKLSFAQAAAIPLAGLTAWQCLFDAAKLQKGETILIQAGAGGVGSLAIQFAKEAGARIITTASQSNHDFVESLGADEMIDYHTQSVKDEIKKYAPQGLDVVFDTLGGKALLESYSYLKPGGRLVSIVEPPNEEIGSKLKIKVIYHFVNPNGKELQHIGDLIDAGKVKPIPIQEMPMEKAAEAQEENRKGHVQGKIVLEVQKA